MLVIARVNNIPLFTLGNSYSILSSEDVMFEFHHTHQGPYRVYGATSDRTSKILMCLPAEGFQTKSVYYTVQCTAYI